MDREEAVAFIEKEDWPLWPHLPMKRSVGGMEPPKTAVMYAGEHTVLYVDVNVFGTPVKDLPDARKQTFDSLDALLDAGWKVD